MLRLEAPRCLLAQRLHEARMSQQELADTLGWDKRKISKYITRETKIMELHTAVLIARTLGCNPQDLYEWKLVREE